MSLTSYRAAPPRANVQLLRRSQAAITAKRNGYIEAGPIDLKVKTRPLRQILTARTAPDASSLACRGL
jgi:hypothetical protein